MDGNFTRKFRFVAGRHTNGPPAEITYSSVFSRDSVWLAFMIAELNDIDVFDAYIGYAYLNASCCEKIWTKYGPDFGSQQGCIMLVVIKLYWLKSSVVSWREIFAEILGNYGIGYTFTAEDKYFFIKREVLPDGNDYYYMILVYVDYILCIHKYKSDVIDALELFYVIRR